MQYPNGKILVNGRRQPADSGRSPNRSLQDLAHHFAVYVGQVEIAAPVAECQPFVVDVQQVQGSSRPMSTARMAITPKARSA